MDNWLREYFPQVRRWQYDDNSGERSINLFHVHVFIEMVPFSFEPRPGMLYLPPHVEQEKVVNANQEQKNDDECEGKDDFQDTSGDMWK